MFIDNRIDMCSDIFFIPGIIEYVYPCYEHIISIYKRQRLVKKTTTFLLRGGRRRGIVLCFASPHVGKEHDADSYCPNHMRKY